MLENPFDSPDVVDGIAKNLEPRWGLTLVSFVPVAAQLALIAIQDRIAARWQPQPPADPVLSLYSPDHMHTTHYTLTRSSAWGPLRAMEFFTERYRAADLFSAINHVTSRAAPLEVRLDRITITHDRLGVILLGECTNQDACRAFMAGLNTALADKFHISPRRADTDPACYHQRHLTLAYLRRSPGDYAAFCSDIKQEITFRPVSYTVKTVTLVHHRFRSLAPPQEGSFTFPLGRPAELGAEALKWGLHLAE